MLEGTNTSTFSAWMLAACWIAQAACGRGLLEDEVPVTRGVVYTYPVDQQRDVPIGAHIIVSFSDPVETELGSAASVIGPLGTVDITVTKTGNDKTLVISSAAFEPGTTYAVFAGAAGEALFRFTTRSDRPLSGPPSLIAVNGSDPSTPGAFRPIFGSSTIQLAFSEPLDPRSVSTEAGAIELVDAAGTAVPVTLFAQGIHVVLDPAAPLVGGAPYLLRFGDRVSDIGGDRLAPTTVAFTPTDISGAGSTRQTFRTRGADDPVAAIERTDAPNVMEVEHPLIGSVSAAMQPAVLATELGDPLVLGGPIAFTIPKGQRLSSGALEIMLAGAVPSGLTTGDIRIELLTDAGGRIYRNRYRDADTLPDNTTSPMLVDLSLDLALFATDPTGNAVLAQTVLGVQLTGLAIADEGALAIETLGALEINLLGISAAPTNLVLDLISEKHGMVPVDQQPPTLVTSLPAADTQDWAADEGIELVFDEPIDLSRARAGGVTLRDVNGATIASTLESHGSIVVVRPQAALLDQHGYRVDLTDVADASGNGMAPTSFALRTQTVVQTDVPASIIAIQPGTPCSLIEATATSAGRCAGSGAADDRYRPFTLAGNERVVVTFDQRIRRESLTLGKTCNTGSIRIERIDAQGACLEAVAGTMLKRQRELAFVPDRPWNVGDRFRLRLVSGPNVTCDAGEVCGQNGRPANFDPLVGTSASAAGGPDLVIDFTGAPASEASTLLTSASPYTDLNGSGHMESSETLRDENRAALRIAGTSGLITSATFAGPDCLPSTPEVNACMYMLGAIPAQLGKRRDNCTLPDGSTVATCVPVTMTPQAMYSTSISMTAGAIGIPITTETGMSVMRLRERTQGPLEGFIIERNGVPTMVVALDLYLDAPDMSLPLTQHDMRSKPLSVSLEGPVGFRSDGRIALTLSNVAEVPITVGINAPLGITGTVKLVVPKGEMRLQLLSRAQRGSQP